MPLAWLFLACSISAVLHADNQETQSPAKTVGELQLLGKQVVPPKILYQTEPDFSEKLRKKKISGTVVIIFVVDEQGLPRELKIKSCSNHVFDAPALNAVKQRRFEPAKVDGQSVPVVANVEVEFFDGTERASSFSRNWINA